MFSRLRRGTQTGKEPEVINLRTEVRKECPFTDDGQLANAAESCPFNQQRAVHARIPAGWFKCWLTRSKMCVPFQIASCAGRMFPIGTHVVQESLAPEQDVRQPARCPEERLDAQSATGDVHCCCC
jgi:hypothetical protein